MIEKTQYTLDLSVTEEKNFDLELILKELNRFADEFEIEFELHHGTFFNSDLKCIQRGSMLAIKGEIGEEKIVHTLDRCNMINVWEAGSHRVSTDISTDIFGNISIKGGVEKRSKDGNIISIKMSGSRTGKYENWVDKKNFHNSNLSDYVFVLSKNLDKTKSVVKYSLYVYDKKTMYISDSDVSESSNGKYIIYNDEYKEVKVHSSMSSQIWYIMNPTCAIFHREYTKEFEIAKKNKIK